MTLEQYLIQIGINVGSNAIYDILKRVATSKKPVLVEELKNEISNELNIVGADIKADQIINFLAENGDIAISNSVIHSKDSILYSAGASNKFSLKDNVHSHTDKSKISVGQGAQIEGAGGAYIHQDDKGNISIGFK